MPQNEYLLKISLIGNPYQISHQLIRSYVSYKGDRSVVVPVEIHMKVVHINHHTIKLILVPNPYDWFPIKVTFGNNLENLFKGSSASIFIFTKASQDSFNAVEGFYKAFREYFLDSNIPSVIIGLISDSEVVTTDKGEGLAKDLGIPYFETQLTDNETIEQIFHHLIWKILKIRS